MKMYNDFLGAFQIKYLLPHLPGCTLQRGLKFVAQIYHIETFDVHSLSHFTYTMHSGKFWLLVTSFAIASHPAFTQDFSNKGKDFWIGYGNHVRMFNNQGAEQMQVYITSDVNTSGSVDIPGIGFHTTFSITANQITTVNIPRAAALTDEGLFNTGIHIVSALPVVVYGFIYVSAISGATVCLPTSVLGREYYSVNYTQISNDPNSYSYFFVVATEDSTVVEITPVANTKGGKPAHIPFTVSLNKGQIYQVLGEATSKSVGADLTGSSIRSINTGSGCKRIAVFCGSGKISIGCSSTPRTSDNLYQEIYPNSSWGKKYVTTPSTNNGTNYQVNFYRIIRPDATATVKLNGTVIPSASFTNNFYYEFSNNTTNIIEADKAIFLVQYFTTSTATGNANCGNDGIGDPEMIYINPVEQTINKVTLNSMQPTSNTNITTHFINVVMKNDAAAINSFEIDGVSKASYFAPVTQDNSYAYARIPVSKGTHNIYCDSGFNAIAYGFGTYESYGYSAGSNLRDLYQYISIENSYSTTSLPATCKNSPFSLDIVLPYQPLNLSWKFNGLLPDTAISAPLADSSWVINGRTLYKYRLHKAYQLEQAGNFPIKVIANNPTSDGCSGEQEINMDLQVYNRPAAAFDTSFGGCLYDSIRLADKTNTGRPNIKWSWEMGDGSIANTKTVNHLYSKAGNYVIQFSSVNDIGCFSDTIQKTVKIDELPVSSFKLPAINCGNDTILFSNQSTLPAGVSATSYWDFGDGSKASSAGITNVSHQYAKEKTYSTSMYSITGKGCKSNVAVLPLTIHYKPKVDFILPEVCISDAYASFINTSVIADSSQAQFTYLWSFGDAANADAANPNTSVAKDGKHAYHHTDYYNVFLKVTSGDGCEADTTKIFTVNGAVPKANFTIEHPANLCSNQPVSIIDASTVDFGAITKAETYWNYANDPSKETIDDEPSPGKKYTFSYPDFGSPLSKTYQLNYVVYSGITCKSTVTKAINLLASPQLTFNALSPVCAEVPAFQLTAASETTGLPGLGVYSGPGVTGGKYFTPGQSLSGVITLSYSFTAGNGCVADTTQTIRVYPTPTVDAGPDRTLLEGGTLVINAIASGDGLTYLWSPPLGITPVQSLTPTVSPAEDIVYTLKATSSDGCVASDQLLVKVLKNIKVPNAFSPNGDNINDTWKIKYLESYPGCEIDVFNRYGQPVYHSTGYSSPWDGSYHGQPLPAATYYYIINPKNGRSPVNGSVTIIR